MPLLYVWSFVKCSLDVTAIYKHQLPTRVDRPLAIIVCVYWFLCFSPNYRLLFCRNNCFVCSRLC